MVQEKELVNTILEGAYRDTPSRLSYAPLSTIVLPFERDIIVNHAHLLLSYRVPVMGNSLITSLKYARSDSAKQLKDDSLPDNSNWVNSVFGMPRSLVTRDGRVYINEVHFKKGFSYYLNCIPQIVRDCGNFYTEK